MSESFYSQITVRLNHTVKLKYNIDQYNEIENLTNRFPFLKINDGSTKLQKLANENKLFVFSYDSTGILEFLYSDIPFIAFWPNQKII